MSEQTKTKSNVKQAEFQTAEKKQELAIFEEIRKNTDLTVSDPSAMKVPVSMVFGRGTTGNLPSFVVVLLLRTHSLLIKLLRMSVN